MAYQCPIVNNKANPLASRLLLIGALMNIDHNGIFSDEDMINEGYEPMTHASAYDLLNEMLCRN